MTLSIFPSFWITRPTALASTARSRCGAARRPGRSLDCAPRGAAVGMNCLSTSTCMLSEAPLPYAVTRNCTCCLREPPSRPADQIMDRRF
jgi:hypothetical protein